jgi:hypothetical protein
VRARRRSHVALDRAHGGELGAQRVVDRLVHPALRSCERSHDEIRDPLRDPRDGSAMLDVEERPPHRAERRNRGLGGVQRRREPSGVVAAHRRAT